MPLGPGSVVLRRGPYVLLTLATALGVLTAGMLHVEAGLPYLLALAGALGVLHYCGADRRWESADTRADRIGQGYFVLRTLLAFAATALNPFFAVFAMIGYFDQHLYLPPRWSPWALSATAVTMAGSQSGGFPPHGALQWGAFAAIFALNAGLAMGFCRLAAQEQSVAQQRDSTIDQLEQANAALHAAMAENARLNQRLVEQAREAGVRDERQRLALEIHDTIAQSLIGVLTQLQAAEDTSEVGSAEGHRMRAADLARAALGEARRSVQGLRPAQLDQAALDVALDRLVREWSQDHGIAGELTITGSSFRQRADVEAAVLRVTQESLTNVAKHACAGRVGVTLSYMEDELSLDVRDDGVGFCPESVTVSQAGGVGLHGMRQRAQKLAGELVVESEVGGGTAVSLRLPAVRGG